MRQHHFPMTNHVKRGVECLGVRNLQSNELSLKIKQKVQRQNYHRQKCTNNMGKLDPLLQEKTFRYLIKGDVKP